MKMRACNEYFQVKYYRNVSYAFAITEFKVRSFPTYSNTNIFSSFQMQS